VCNNTGYKGRAGLFELLTPDSEVKRLVTHKAASDEIMRYSIKAGLVENLRRDGLRKVVDGITTLEQVMGATQSE
jgi:type IV pilus assembly protein PilB